MIVVAVNFTGYPDGSKRKFVAGEKPSGLSKDYQNLLVAKELAKRKGTKRGKRSETE